jgi:uncharacterized protein YsxB (DUF464 family)
VQLTCNGVTEVLKCGADVEATADTVRITLPPKADDSASRFIEALHVHLDILAHDYADFIEVSVHKNG